MKKATVTSNKPKLELKRKTVKQLTTDQLGNAAGGFPKPCRPRDCTDAASGC